MPLLKEFSEFEHIGDAVYVMFDGYSVQLKINDPKDPMQVPICMEPFVWEAFRKYLSRLETSIETYHKANEKESSDSNN